jgi:D-alanine-D-alanine ligase
MEMLEGEPLFPLLGQGKFRTAAGQELAIDVLFPILHGKNGEDGTVQGMATLLHVPCVGPGLIGSAIAMDKDITKHLLRDGGVPVVDWLTWQTYESVPEYAEVSVQLGSDILFVKPANAGSSVGVSRVTSGDEFITALHGAAQHDTIVLIEPAVRAREVELAVRGTTELHVATPGEIVPGAEFYSYDDKYAAGSQAACQIPAQLDEPTVERLQSYALQAYRLTRGQGMARVDFFVTPEGQIYLNEINTIPGFTNISMYPKMWQHDGLNCSELLDALIADAILKIQ